MSEQIEITPEQREKLIQWRSLKETAVWKELVSELERLIGQADQIVNTVGADRELEFTKRDVAVIKKQACQALIEYPDSMINRLSGTGRKPTENFDPFEPDEDTLEDDDLGA